MALLDDLQARLAQAEQGGRRPPLDQWHPPLSGDIDIRIAADGSWFHDGELIRRARLVQLFASVLRREGSDYVLVTPVEKWRIRVDDTPFVAVTVDQVLRDHRHYLLFTTNVDDQVIASRAHPLQVSEHAGSPYPLLYVRDGLWARVARNAFYELVTLAREDSGGRLMVDSDDESFTLGSI